MQNQFSRLIIVALAALFAIGLNVGVAEEKEVPQILCWGRGSWLDSSMATH